MTEFFIGLAGAFVGGLSLAGAIAFAYFYEKRQARKQANKLVNDLKAMYYESLSTKTAQKGSNTIN